MATLLYEPAFTIVAKWFRAPGERRRAMTAITLVAALASFIFLPPKRSSTPTAGAPRSSCSGWFWPRRRLGYSYTSAPPAGVF
jgi:hypothetical protein